MPGARPVVCVQTGEVFPSITKAAYAVQRHPAAIFQAIQHPCKCAGYNWKYETENPNTPEYSPAEQPAESL
eukprot:g74039.t1